MSSAASAGIRDLATTAGRGGIVTLSGQLGRLLLYGASVVVLARMLTPADYGLLAMVVAVVGIGEVMRDFGLSYAAIQARTLSEHERSNLFWVNFAAGTVLATFVFLAGPLLGALYEEPRLAGIARSLAVVYLINGAIAQYQAGMTRDMKFSRLAIAEVSGPAIGLLAAVAVAAQGGGYWALVAQQIVTQATLLVLIFFLAGRWRPSRYRRDVPIGGLLRFGIDVFIVQLLTYASRNVDSFMVGLRAGARTLGTYNMAFQLMIMPLNQLNAPATKVALPTLSRLQERPAEFARFAVAGQAMLVNVILPVLAVLAALAPGLVELVVGPQWVESVPLLRILVIGGVAQAVSYATYWCFLALGLTRSNLRYALVTRPVMVAAIVAGSAWGATGVAWAYSASLVAFWPLGLAWIARAGRAPSLHMFANGARAIAVHGTCGFAAFWFAGLAESFAVAWGLAIGVLAYLSTWGLIVAVWPAARGDVRTIIGVARSAVDSKKG